MPDPSPNFAKELSAIDFESLLGGPMVATINAQAKSAMTTLNFIKNDVFIKDGKLQTVAFEYEKQVPVPGGGGMTMPTSQKLTAPLLSMVPIPFIRVEKLFIDLNVKLHSLEEDKSSSETTKQFNASGGGWGWVPKMSVSVSSRNTTSNSKTVDREYSMQVQLTAVQDTMPGGLAKILSIFEQAIESQAKSNEATESKSGEGGGAE